MVFTPFTIDTGSANTSYNVVGLIPGKQYNVQVTAKNSIGSSTISAAVPVTMNAQSSTSTPTRVIGQVANFRDNATGIGSITLSLPSIPNAANAVLVFMCGHGSGADSPAIVTPSSATKIGGPFYDTGSGLLDSEVQYAWIIQGDVSNSYTFSNYDSSDYSGWRIIEVANVASYDFQHGPATEVGSTSITWPLTVPANQNSLRFTNISSNNTFATVGAGSTGVTVLLNDLATDSFHGGFFTTETPAITGTATVAITGGNSEAADNPSFLTVTVYGGGLPAQVSNLTSSNVTSSGVRLAWTAVAGATSYTIMYEGGGISSFTQFSLPVPATSTSTTLTGLIPSTSYSFEVFASNSSGQGPVSTITPIATLAVQAINYVQSAVGQILVGGEASTTITATFQSNTTIGNTLGFFYTGFADPNNLALVAPAGSSNSTGMLQDDGASTDPCCMFWTQPVTAAKTAYSFVGPDDEGSLFVWEIQGVTSVATAIHAGNLTAVDGTSGHVVVPVSVPTTTPAINFIMVNMTNAPDSWGTPPSNMQLLQSATGNSSITPIFHQGALFSATSAVTGNQTLPYSLAVGTQVAPPTYIAVAFSGSAGVVAPGQVTVTTGATTSSSQVLNWTAPTGTTTSYTAQYRVTGTTTYTTASNTITALTYTVSGLLAATSYDFVIIAFNGITAGASSAIVSKTTLSSSPSQVTGLTLGTVTSTTQAVSWTSPGGTITSYTLQYKLATATTFTNVTGITGVTTVVSSLTPNSSYNYQVLALNGTNSGPVSAQVTGSTTALPAPGQPTGVTLGAVTSTSQVVSWTASTGTVTTYQLLYSSVSNTGPWTTLQGITSTTTTVNSLIPSTVYYFEVIGFNGATPSAASTVVNGTTSGAVPPGQVVGFTLGVTASTSQSLNWSIPSGTVTSYTLMYKITGAGSFTSVTGIVPNSYVVTGLAPSTNYTYQVVALNTTVAGSASSTLTNTTLTSSGTQGSSLVTIGGKLLVVGGRLVIA